MVKEYESYCERRACDWRGKVTLKDTSCPECGSKVVLKTGLSYDEYKDLHLDDDIEYRERLERERGDI